MNFNDPSNRKITEMTYRAIRGLAKPVAENIFKPLVLGSEKVPTSGPIVFAPNHRKTLDSFIVVLISSTPTHWGALKRFFDKEDSFFNNSKNPILCHLTSMLLKGMGAHPVDREGDNSETLKNFNEYLRLGSSIGIFPESGTNKNPEIEAIAKEKLKSGIVHFAKDNDAPIEPISLTWIPKELGISHQVIANYREPYKVGDMSIQDGMDMWVESVSHGLLENDAIINHLKEMRKLLVGTSLELRIK